ncbi:MAG: glycosyl hydrolase, partial [Bacteroidota bacterium]
MKKKGFIIMGFFLLIQIGFSQQTIQSTFNSNNFKNPPQSAKVYTWWHWVQGSISKDGITKDLESMKAQGIAEATII